MSYPINDTVLSLFTDRYRQLVNITLYGADEILTITEKDIQQRGLTIDRVCVSNSKVEIGSAIASELKLVLNNRDGRFDDVVFEGAEMFIQIGVKKWDSEVVENEPAHYIPMGFFTVDKSPRKLSSISLTALDRMAHFDNEVDLNALQFPVTVGELLAQICDMCNVMVATEIDTLINRDYVISVAPSSENLTYRQILQWICEITGTCAYIDWDGKLRLDWFDNKDVSAIITPSERYSSDLTSDAITISGVKVSDVLVGDTGYVINIESNELIQNDVESIATSLYEKIGGFTYYPYSCSIKPFVNLYPLDMICFCDKHGVDYVTCVTNTTFTINGNLSVSAQGESVTENGYARGNPLTKQERVIIDAVKTIVNEKMNNRLQSVLSMNQAIAGAMGLYTTVVQQPNGSGKYYFHSNPVLTNSKVGEVIYTINEGGFACCTTGWNDGNPVWETGFTKDGNAIVKNISAYGVEVSTPENDFSARITPEAFEIWYRAIKMMSANGDESQFTKIKAIRHIECGRVRIAPHYTNGELVGTNLIFLDD